MSYTDPMSDPSAPAQRNESNRDLPPGVTRHRPVPRAARGEGALLDVDLEQLWHGLAATAKALGFVRWGVCSAEPFHEAAGYLGAWLAQGYGGEMAYLSSVPRHRPRALLPQAESVIVVALPCGPPGRTERGVPPKGSQAEPSSRALVGRVASYARGQDYHRVIADKLRSLADSCAQHSGQEILARVCVDTAPLLEREAARRAGVGFTAKSTLSIAPGAGSHLLLGVLLVDVALPPSSPIPEGCGGCRSCLDACPTQAFVQPGVLDARRCISYLTIEHRGVIPRELRASMGSWVFGCDICQDVCPYNQSRHRPPSSPDLNAPLDEEPLQLERLLALRSGEYRRLVKGTALQRVSRPRLQRNAAVALGNTRDERVVPALRAALSTNESSLVRLHCAWALGQIPSAQALTALEEHRQRERDEAVQSEIKDSMDRIKCEMNSKNYNSH